MKTVLLTLCLYLPVFLYAQDPELIESLKQHFQLTSFDRPSNIIRLNRDTILVAGFMRDVTGNQIYSRPYNVFYKTEDGGKTWRMRKFDGDAWLYTSDHDQNCRVWIGGSDEIMYYSSDCGESLNVTIKPFVPHDRITAICMLDSVYGIAGGLSNGLAITEDNWASSTQIPSPLDQNKYRILERSSRDRVIRVGILDSLMLINQNNYIFYSNKDSISWRRFNVPVVDFMLDKENCEIDLTSSNGRHFVIGSDLELIREYREEQRNYDIPNEGLPPKFTSFHLSPIKLIEISAIQYDFVGPIHLSAEMEEKTQRAWIRARKDSFIFRAKYYDSRTLNVNAEELQEILSVENLVVEPTRLHELLTLDEDDYHHYYQVLEEEKASRSEKAVWGGNFTSQIPLSHPVFLDPQKNITNLHPFSYAELYRKRYFPWNHPLNQERDHISVLFKNRKGESFIISNEHATLFSLPWTITYKGQTVISYNPEIATFLRDFIPKDFSNYHQLLGGDLIYRLLEEEIIEQLEYH